MRWNNRFTYFQTYQLISWPWAGALHGTARRGEARRGETWRGVAGRCEARLSVGRRTPLNIQCHFLHFFLLWTQARTTIAYQDSPYVPAAPSPPERKRSGGGGLQTLRGVPHRRCPCLSHVSRPRYDLHDHYSGISLTLDLLTLRSVALVLTVSSSSSISRSASVTHNTRTSSMLSMAMLRPD